MHPLISASRIAHHALGACVLMAALVGGASALAQSTSHVTLYGLVDLGLNTVSGLASNSGVNLASGVMEGSRWGLRGNEDMGAGYRTLFTLESRFEADNGILGNRPVSGLQLPDRLAQASLLGFSRTSPLYPTYQALVTGVGSGISDKTLGVNLAGRLFDRQAFVGLVTPFGGILAGRQYTPAYEALATFDVMHTQSSLSPGQLISVPFGVDIRVSNALAYRIEQGAFSASLMLAPGELPGGSARGRMWGANGFYKSSGFSVGFGYNTRNNELGPRALTTALVGLSKQVGPGEIIASYTRIEDHNPADLSTIAADLARAQPTLPAAIAGAVQSAFIDGLRQESNLFHLGYRFATGPGTLMLSYSLLNDKRIANSDASSYGVAYSYPMSKRTDLYGVLARFRNSNLSQIAPGGGGFLGGVTSSAGVDSTNTAVGLRHTF